MSNGMPELGSKISLISKADIRYEGRLFTVDPQECTIALSAVRSFGTEDRETQCPVPAQSQVYDYILFRGSDIKDIRVLNNVPQQTFNDPAIMQLSVPPTWANQQQQFGLMGPHMPIPPMGQYAPFGGIPSNAAPGMQNQPRKPNFLDNIIGGGASRSTTPASQRSHKSVDQSVQAGGNKSNNSSHVKRGSQRRTSNSRERKDSTKSGGEEVEHHGHRNNNRQGMGHLQQHQQRNYQNYGYHQQRGGNGWNNRGTPRTTRGGMMSGRSRGGANMGYHRSMMSNNGTQNANNNANRKRNTLKFDKDYDFEQANSEFAELRSQFAKVKIDEVSSTKQEPEKPLDAVTTNGEHEKKDDSGNETGAGETEQEEENHEVFYDKKKSFFDKISCEAIERAKGKMQRTDWRQERKLNSETFGVAATRRGNFRGRGIYRGSYNNRGGYRPNYRQNQEQQHHQNQHHQSQQRKEQGNVTYPILNYNAPSFGDGGDDEKKTNDEIKKVTEEDETQPAAVDLTDIIEVCPGLGEGPVDDATNQIDAK